MSRAWQAVRAAAWPLLLLLPLLVSLWGVGDLPLYTKGEAREAVEVWAEVHGGGWILPLRNGNEIPSKPPLFHWLAGGASLLRGRVDEVAVRLPSLLFAALAVVAVAAAGARRWGATTGILAGAILATSFEWLRAARGARVDMVLAGCLTSALLCLETMLHGPVVRRRVLVGFYASLALAVLAKGPVGFVLPMLVMVVHLALRGELHRLRELAVVRGSLLALAVPALWYAAAVVVGGEAFFERQVLHENVFRFLGAGEVRRSHAHPFWYHGPAFLAGFLPWSVFLVPLGAWLVRERRRLAEDGRLYCVVWAAVIFVFYSIPSSKRSVYTLPAYPAVALLMACWWRSLMREAGSVSAVWRRLASGVSGGVGIAAVTVAACGALLARGGVPAPGPRLVRAGLAGVAAHAPVAVASGAVAVVSGLLAARALRAGRWRAGAASYVALASAVAALVIGAIEPGIAAATTMRPFMQRVLRELPPGGRLYFLGGHPDYEVMFYANRRLPTVRRRVLACTAATEPDARVLLFEHRWRTLPPEVRERLQPIATSVEVRDDDRGRLMMARLVADQDAHAACGRS